MSTSSPDPFSGSSFHRPPPSSNPEPGSSGSPTLTSLLELISSNLYNTNTTTYVNLAFWLAFIFLCFYLAEQRRDHRAEGQPCMEWPIRLKIAGGVARGLVYLHENCYPKIFHKDIKPSNILLDSNFEPKIADFGIASEGSHVPSPLEGTSGYVDPELFTTGFVTDKTDVYAFGVVLLELITGRRAVDQTREYPESSLVDSTRPKLAQAMENGNLDELVDPRLQNYSLNEMMMLIGCAIDCVQKFGTKRPSMKKAQLLIFR